MICPAEAIRLKIGAGLPLNKTEMPLTCVLGKAERLSVLPNPVPKIDTKEEGLMEWTLRNSHR